MEKRRWWVLALGVAAMAVVLGVGVGRLRDHRRHDALKEKAAQARSQLAQGIASDGKVVQPYYQDYLVPAYREGIHLIDSRPVGAFETPALLVASVDPRPASPLLTLLWLETGFQARSLELRSEGRVVAEGSVFAEWSPRVREWFGRSLWRDAQIHLLYAGEPGPVTTKVPGDWPPLHVPRDLLGKPLEAVLITSDGRRSNAVRVYVPRPAEVR